MSWTALVPIKLGAERKTRLASGLSHAKRVNLSNALLHHVLEMLQQSAEISRIVILSRMRPSGWNGQWTFDSGRGLNAELKAAVQALGSSKLLVVHHDLPLLAAEDIAALIRAGQSGCAIAPDRHGTGTNALALADATGFAFGFGRDSFHRHRRAAGNGAIIVERPGLALDIDTPADLEVAQRAGFQSS